MESSLNAAYAANDQIREQLNWGLIFGLLGCVAFWGAVVFGIVATL